MINKGMKIDEIRIRTAYNPVAKPTQKAATRMWLCSKSKEFPLALTLTLKQTIVETNARGTIRRKLTRIDCERIAKRFTKKLNREVFGKRGAEKYGHSLKYLPVVEGERSSKNLHLHFAIGGLPKHVRFNQFDRLVTNAKLNVEFIDAQHKVDITDSGWIEYITKEVGSKDTDNVLWRLA
jgi:hypothetical protein